MLGWIFLAFAVCLDVLGTFAAKYANGFTTLIPSLITIGAYCLSFTALTFSIKTLDVSVAYPVWTGSAIFLVAVLGAVFFHETVNFFKVFSTLLVVFGIVGLVVSSQPDAAACPPEVEQTQHLLQSSNRPRLSMSPVFHRLGTPVLYATVKGYSANVIRLKPEFSEN